MQDHRETPTAMKFLVGTAVGILITICIGVSIVSGAVVSIPLKIILFIPDKLGLVWKITPENTLVFNTSGTFRLSDLTAGRYLIYFDAGVPTARIDLEFTGTGAVVPINPIRNPLTVDQYHFGLAPVDVPSYRFQIEEQGTYLLHLDYWGVPGLHITPDISSHNDWVLVGSTIVQGAIMALLIWSVYRWRNQDRVAEEKARKSAGREKFDDWMEKYRDGKDL